MLATFTVDTVADVVNAADGVTSLREAVAAANATGAVDTINFAPALTANGPATIVLTQGELLLAAPATIDGPGADKLTIDANFLSRIFNITAATGNFTLDGMTLTRGITTGSNGMTTNLFSGGAVRSATSGMLFLTGMHFATNATTGARASGGAVFAGAGVTVINSVFTENFTFGEFADGGGLFATGDATVQQSVISQNHADGNASTGGGIAGLGRVTAVQSVVNQNTTNTENPTVGGVKSTLAATLVQSQVTNNRGIGVLSTGGIVLMTQSTVAGNSLLGVVSPTQSVSAIDSTISGNNGGIMASGSVTLTRSTVTRNFATSASVLAGGAYSSNGNVSLTQSIVAFNVSVAGAPDLDSGGDLVGAIRSLIGNKTGTNLVEAPLGAPDVNGNFIGGPVGGVINPKLGLLANNGGYTFIDGSRLLTHAPLPGSPVINTGDPAAIPGEDGVPFSDQRSDPWVRIAGGRIDIGAIESQVNPLPGDYNFNGIVDAADYTVWRNTVGSVDKLQADGSGPTVGVPDGVVNSLDYTYWKSKFGTVLPPGAGSGEQGAAVVEQEVAAGELRLAGTVGEEESEAVAVSTAGIVDAGFAAVAAPAGNRRDVARRLLGRHSDGARDARADALVAWLASRREVAAGDRICERPSADAESAAAGGSSLALDAVFDLLGEAV